MFLQHWKKSKRWSWWRRSRKVTSSWSIVKVSEKSSPWWRNRERHKLDLHHAILKQKQKHEHHDEEIQLDVFFLEIFFISLFLYFFISLFLYFFISLSLVIYVFIYLFILYLLVLSWVGFGLVFCVPYSPFPPPFPPCVVLLVHWLLGERCASCGFSWMWETITPTARPKKASHSHLGPQDECVRLEQDDFECLL